jgi:hypothetical protein
MRGAFPPVRPPTRRKLAAWPTHHGDSRRRLRDTPAAYRPVGRPPATSSLACAACGGGVEADACTTPGLKNTGPPPVRLSRARRLTGHIYYPARAEIASRPDGMDPLRQLPPPPAKDHRSLHGRRRPCRRRGGQPRLWWAEAVRWTRPLLVSSSGVCGSTRRRSWLAWSLLECAIRRRQTSCRSAKLIWEPAASVFYVSAAGRSLQ